MLDWLTFGLAMVGYALLAFDAARRWRGARSAPFTALVAAVVAAHVGCVWALRFDWSLQAMLDKSLPAFVLFHAAFAAILGAAIAPEPWRTRLCWLGFAVVSLGALPAPWRYAEIAVLRVPMLATFAVAVAAGLGLIGRPRTRP